MLTELGPLTLWVTLPILIITAAIWALLRSAERKLSTETCLLGHSVSTVAVIFLAGWAVLAFFLSWNGVFEAGEGMLFPVILLGIAMPLGAGLAFLSRSKKLALVLKQVPQNLLVALQLYRAFGVLFLLLYSAGQLPAVFAIPAGVGDIFVGLTAPIVAYLYTKGYSRSCLAVLAWNVVGIADLALAVTLGFLSSPGPFQILALDNPNTLITSFPLVLIPTFAVPLSIVFHFASLRILRQSVLERHARSGKEQIGAYVNISRCESYSCPTG